MLLHKRSSPLTIAGLFFLPTSRIRQFITPLIVLSLFIISTYFLIIAAFLLISTTFHPKLNEHIVEENQYFLLAKLALRWTHIQTKLAITLL